MNTFLMPHIKKQMRKAFIIAVPVWFCSLLLPVNTIEAAQIEMVSIEVASEADMDILKRLNIDIIRRHKPEFLRFGFSITAAIAARDKAELRKAGIPWVHIESTSDGDTAEDSYVVYRSFDDPHGGIRVQLEQFADTYPDIVTLHEIGKSIQGRPIIALRITGNPDTVVFFKQKPAVLFLATHHAREWAACEMAMRLIRYFTENYGALQRVTTLLDEAEVWVIPVANPDGYQYTFTTERLWRKNLRDNDQDGVITEVDGVDLNRNFDFYWGHDDEGSSPDESDFDYRGPEPNSEPETRAVTKFIMQQRHRLKFIVSYHTFAGMILYPWWWKEDTPSYDDPIFVALAGTRENPAIWSSLIDRGYIPGVAGDVYGTVVNGNFTDWHYGTARIPGFLIELTAGVDAEGQFYGFEFPDDEALLQSVFEDNLAFALACVESAKQPASPVSLAGIEPQNIYHTPVNQSEGPEQRIDVLAKKRHIAVLLYTINSGRKHMSLFLPAYDQDDRFGIHYCKYTAVIRGQNKGDEVSYWISSQGKQEGSFTYTVGE